MEQWRVSKFFFNFAQRTKFELVHHIHEFQKQRDLRLVPLMALNK